ncbi:MAG: peptidoglycan DD-metalloendopeptidase family protein [Pseudomonadota bacterium]
MPRCRKVGLALLALLAVAVLAVTAAAVAWQPVVDGPAGRFSGPQVQPPGSAEVRYTIRSGENIVAIMDRFGVPSGAVVAAARSVYDLSRIRAGREIIVGYRRGVGHAVSFSYCVDEDHTVVVAETSPGEWAPGVEEVVYETGVVTRQLVIRSSLWQAAVDAGLRYDDIVRLSGIFEWDVDFNTELHEGDTFSLVADGLFLDGELRKLGTIHAVRLVGKAKNLVGIRHEGAGGQVGYFDLEGKARRRPFLRSPLAFTRVTSGYRPQGRFHPVLKKTRPHNGTDLGAPVGTPIRSVSDGVVSAAGNAGGYGQLVRVRHEGGYESGYAHMSKILVKKGQRVQQGQVIGHVGMSGLSTGPHCHYELKLNGRYVDPMKAKLPVSVPLPASEKAAFEQERDRWAPFLDPPGAGQE